MSDDGKCADHAVAFTCGVPVETASEWLRRAGRPIDHDGSTDAQIASAVRACGGNPVTLRSCPRTLRTFARERRPGSFILFTFDHVVACVNGYLCDLSDESDLARIEKVWKII